MIALFYPIAIEFKSEKYDQVLAIPSSNTREDWSREFVWTRVGKCQQIMLSIQKQ